MELGTPAAGRNRQAKIARRNGLHVTRTYRLPIDGFFDGVFAILAGEPHEY
jgi:hypothetical protein